MPLKQTTLTFTGVDQTPQEGAIGLTRGRLRLVSVCGFDASGNLVDDLAFTLTDPTGTKIVWTPTPARAIADPRLFLQLDPDWPINDTSNFTVTIRRIVVNTGITVTFTFVWAVESLVQT